MDSKALSVDEWVEALKRKPSDEAIGDWCALEYQLGEGVAQLAAAVGWSIESVRKSLDSRGIRRLSGRRRTTYDHPRQRKPKQRKPHSRSEQSIEIDQSIREAYEKGITWRALASELGITVSAISLRARRMGLYRKRGPRPKKK